jgi:hypothetical protein
LVNILYHLVLFGAKISYLYNLIKEQRVTVVSQG